MTIIATTSFSPPSPTTAAVLFSCHYYLLRPLPVRVRECIWGCRYSSFQWNSFMRGIRLLLIEDMRLVDTMAVPSEVCRRRLRC